MKKLKNDLINGILVIIAFVFNILIFAPIEIYYTNKSELWFNIKDILPIIILFAICIISILIFLIIFLKGKKQRIFVTIIFVLTIGLYIQGNFLNFGYNQLDGEEINWRHMIVKGIINTVIWLIIIAIPIILKKIKKEENFKLTTSITSIFIILIQIITLITLVITNKEETVQGLSNNNIFNLSKEKNIVVFMSDTFEGTYMNEILKEYPEYKEKLKDFIYFDNCTGVSFFTYSSMPTLLTGIECKVGNSLNENLEYCFNNTELYKILKENNYSSEIYTEKALTPPVTTEGIDNLNMITNIPTEIDIKKKIVGKMYKYTLYRYLPHFLKSNFQITSAEFNKIKSIDRSISYKEKTYFIDDVIFNKALQFGGISTVSSNKTFKFYQLDGMHAPYNTTQELEYNQTKEYEKKEDKEKRFNEALASLNLLCNYIDELKKAGIYNQTTIMFLADHGYDNRFYTNLMVKKENSNQEFKISSAPVSLKDDLIPTILNIATDSKKYGKDFFDYEEKENRIRQVYDYTYESKGAILNRYKFISRIIFQTKGKAEEEQKFYPIEEEYYNQDKKITDEYEFGTLIEVSKISASKCINLVGFNLSDLNFMVSEGWNISKNAYVEINRKKSKSNVEVELKINQIYNKQRVNFKIEKKEIYSCVLNQSGLIKFEIPKDIWNKNEKIKLEMEFPDAKLGHKHATMMTAIQLETIKFTN